MKATKRILLFTSLLCSIALSSNAFSQTRPIPTSIRARASGINDRTIEVQWEVPERTEPPIISFKVYRSSRRIYSYTEVERLLPIATIKTNRFTDTKVEAGEYFYAVVAVTKSGDYKSVIPGMNTTVDGVRARSPIADADVRGNIPGYDTDGKFIDEVWVDPPLWRILGLKSERLYDATVSRNPPLPYPDAILGMDYERTEMSEEAIRKMRELGGAYIKRPEAFKNPYFFEADMFASQSGDDYVLFETLRAALVKKQYVESVRLLTEYLSVNRSKDPFARATFYLGESYYFCKNYEMAIRCFLRVQEAFPELTREWIDSSLDLLSVPVPSRVKSRG